MSAKRVTFDELIEEVRELDKALSSPESFYRDHVDSYHAEARRIAEKVLIDARPATADRVDWARKARLVADRVAAHLMLGGGMVLSLAASKASDGSLEPDKNNRPFEQRMSHADIVEWIKAGQEGRPGGKRITPDDEAFIRKHGINAKATIVMRAYYSREPMSSYRRLRRAIQDYFFGTEKTDTDPLLDAISVAWTEYFSVRFPQDMADHVTRVVRRF